MAKDKKDKKKGQTMSLNDFVGETSTANANDTKWAEDQQWEDEAEETNAVAGPRGFAHGRTAGAMGDFRSEKSAASSRIVDYNMEKPYLGFVANLLTNLPESEVRDFFADANIAIENIKMIYKERSTFAFVEFESPQGLQMAILLEGKFLKNRPVKVDIATDDQREKMKNDKARGMGPRDPKSPNSQFPDRDAMGSEQRSFASDRRAPRSNTSANAPRDFEFSRDGMGGAQPELSTDFSSLRRTPNSANPPSSGGGFGGFANFRDTDKVEQPTMERRMPRQGSRDSMNKDGEKKEGGNWRGGGSKVASPTVREGGNWRDQPAAEQPSGDKRPKREEKEEKSAPAPSAGKTLQIGGEAQPAPKKDLAPPKAAAPPKTNAWGASAASNADRFASFRN